MFLVGGEAAGRVIKAVGSPFQYDPFKYLSQRANQSFVAGDAGDFQVQVLVVDQALAREASLDVRAVTMHLSGQFIEGVVAHVFDRFFNRESLQGFTHIVQLFRLLQSNFFAGKTAIRQKRYVTFLHKPSKRFAHGSATDAETVAEFLMMQFLARHDLVAQNQVLDLGINAHGEIFGGARFGFRFT